MEKIKDISEKHIRVTEFIKLMEDNEEVKIIVPGFSSKGITFVKESGMFIHILQSLKSGLRQKA